MLIRVLQAATTQPVTLEQLKAHAKIEYAEEDEVLKGILSAATEHVASELARVLAPTAYRLELQHWCRRMHAPLAPVRDVPSVSYLDEGGMEHTVPADAYSWYRTDDGAIVQFAQDFEPPQLMPHRADALRVDIDAGYDDPASSGSGEDPELLFPQRAGLAIKLLAASWFMNREATSSAEVKVVPLAVDVLLRAPGLKVYR